MTPDQINAMMEQFRTEYNLRRLGGQRGDQTVLQLLDGTLVGYCCSQLFGNVIKVDYVPLFSTQLEDILAFNGGITRDELVQGHAVNLPDSYRSGGINYSISIVNARHLGP
jgi:hypothetical protein